MAWRNYALSAICTPIITSGFTTLRYANVFGPRQNPRGEAGVVSIFIRQMLQGEIPTIFGDGSKTRDYVFVEDVVSANLLALGASRCGTFNIGRGVQVSDYEIFSAIRQEVGFADEPKFGPPRTGEVEHICVNAKLRPACFGGSPLLICGTESSGPSRMFGPS